MNFKFLSALLLVANEALAQTPPGFSPSTKNTLGVKYGNINASNGDLVPISDAAMSSTLSFASNNASHVVVLVDLDAPNGTDSHAYAPFLHWVKFIPSGVTTLPGGPPLNMSDFAPYFGPAPPPGTGPHRYVTLLFGTQNSTFQVPPSFKQFNGTEVTDRIKFDIETFVDEGRLDLVAANWFTSENNTAVAAVTNDAPRMGVAGAAALVAFGLLRFASQLI
ncbi:uncharacterized protein NECHADRAFT_88114 [Fusarium vanettenii 77-13-4]|uniref:PEBP-like protein n=1 Tax=Fusarium vanettenii (strain ATCC MYA-4622 / CBS 123669 / FGSC 9596 / NRRL 45880 / 77-13-4) TaxID=660122 RepID=C7ZDN6_FUSV7|nr:uncharacterized protein NECHADRAFT_88114 [Fusarium vanettenii 77-13-4]EEU37740.1 hypothetical protein NECHADRAFT_88114 [Fusarium vanettenii 77-13-4]